MIYRIILHPRQEYIYGYYSNLFTQMYNMELFYSKRNFTFSVCTLVTFK